MIKKMTRWEPELGQEVSARVFENATWMRRGFLLESISHPGACSVGASVEEAWDNLVEILVDGLNG